MKTNNQTASGRFIPQVEIGGLLPNCDAFIDPKDLHAVRHECKSIAKHFQTLASYCEGKAHAMECRIAGKIELAQKFEAAAEAMYNLLPESFKW